MLRERSIVEELRNLTVAVTGAAGTIGRELVRQLASAKVPRIIALDCNESELFFLSQEYRHDGRVSVALANIRDPMSIKDSFAGVDLVYHAAALKHVPLCEASPMEAVKTNIDGTQFVLDAAVEAGVRRLVFTSTDKAVNPTNVMGTSKLMAERLVTAANSHHVSSSGFRALSTRFGNVLGSRGSVVPLFARQIRAGGPVTLTDRQMTRFIMTLEQAVELVLQSAFLGEGGEVFITKMPVVRTEDLASVLIDALAPHFGHDPTAIEVNEIGSRPGEKLYEELMNEEEVRRSWDIGRFLVVQPALDDHGRTEKATPVDRIYNSSVESAMSASELRRYLESSGLIDRLLGHT